MKDDIDEILYPDLSKDLSKNNWKGIWYLLKGLRWTYISSLLTQLISILFRSSLYLVLAWFVDTWLQEETHSINIWGVAGLFILVNCGQALFSYISGIQMNRTAERVAQRLRDNFYDHVQHLAFSWQDKADTGDLVTRATGDIDAVRKLFSEQIYGIGRVLSFFIINFTMLWKINSHLALLNIAVLPAILGTSFLFFKIIAKVYQEYEAQDSVVFTVLQENLTGVRVVKAFARQAYEIEKFDREAEKRYQIGKKELLYESLFWPASDVLCYIQLGISLYIGVKAAMAGTISLGDFVAYQSLITLIIWPLRNLGRQIVFIGRSMVSFGRLRQVLQAPEEDLLQGTDDLDFRGKIVFDRVSSAYGEKEALHDISFSTEPGQVTAIIGSTGSGKTSLVNLLPRFYDYNGGSITIDGIELNQISRRKLRDLIGIVEQEPFLFSCTIAENISYGVGREVSREEVIAAAKAASIHESIMKFDKNYDTIVGERGVTLSGGQKQRVAIARAFLKDPRILILDDSLSAVDTVTEAAIQKSLDELMKGRTTFIIAHRTTSIMNADRILVMDGKTIVQQGTHQELVNQDGLYKEIHSIQTRIEDELEKEVNGE